MYACLSFIVVNINTVINVTASGKKIVIPILKLLFLSLAVDCLLVTKSSSLIKYFRKMNNEVPDFIVRINYFRIGERVISPSLR